jgi:hypothetical protein
MERTNTTRRQQAANNGSLYDACAAITPCERTVIYYDFSGDHAAYPNMKWIDAGMTQKPTVAGSYKIRSSGRVFFGSKARDPDVG